MRGKQTRTTHIPTTLYILFQTRRQGTYGSGIVVLLTPLLLIQFIFILLASGFDRTKYDEVGVCLNRGVFICFCGFDDLLVQR